MRVGGRKMRAVGIVVEPFSLINVLAAEGTSLRRSSGETSRIRKSCLLQMQLF